MWEQVIAALCRHLVKQLWPEHASRVVLLCQIHQGLELGVQGRNRALGVQEGAVKVLAPVWPALVPAVGSQQCM